jgi:membrane protease YdiL (CAAX protease family)
MTDTPLFKEDSFIFLVLVLVIGTLAYLPWILASYSFIPSYLAIPSVLIGGITPTITAIIITYRKAGIFGVRLLFSGFTKKCSVIWFLIALTIPFLTFYPAILISNLMTGGGEVPVIDILLFSIFLLQMLIMNVWEEIGWRGYAQPALQKRFNGLLTSIIIAVVWSLWHIPHFIVQDSQMLSIHDSFLIFIGETIFASIIYAWLYNSSNGNLIVVTLFHAATNALGSILIVITGYSVPAIYILLLNGLIACIILLVFRSKFFEEKVVIDFGEISTN